MVGRQRATRAATAHCLWLASALALAGCTPASQATFTLQPAAPPGDAEALVWPAAPDPPRFVYAGQLRGAENYVADRPERRHGAQRALRWLVGLGPGRGEAPLVLLRPNVVAVAPDGRVLVGDMGRPAVLVFDPAAAALEVWDRAWPGQPLRAPSGLVALEDGSVLLADAELGAVVRLDRDGRPEASLGQGVLQRPGGLAWDPLHRELYVADIRAHDIKVFDNAGQLLRTLGGPGEGAGRFNAPNQLAFADGLLYVTDTFNGRVQVLSPDGEPRGLVGRRGLYVGNLVRPKGVAVDGAGRIYVMESYYAHLLIFDAAGNFLLPLATDGTPLGGLHLPGGIAVDPGGQVYVADMYNGRVLVFRYVGAD